MPNYINSKIYTIRFNNSNDIYIGSTCNTLSRRFYGHKFPPYTSLSYLIQYKYNNDWSICYIELYENYSCNNKDELSKREGEIIRLFINDNNYNCINKNIAGRTDKEYREDNKDKIREYKKEYYEDNIEYYKKYREDNKDKIKEDNKKYREDNKDKIKEEHLKYREDNIEYYKKYREDNKDKIKEQLLKWRENNRDKLKDKRKEKINCECGSICGINDKARHFRTLKHMEYIASLNP